MSTGPRTEEGKAAVGLNATTHGLASHKILSYEDPNRYNDLLTDITLEFQPVTESQAFLVRQMTQARWRIYRIARLMNATFDSMLGAADTECPDVRLAQALAESSGDSVAKLQRYHNDAERSYYKAKREMEKAKCELKLSEQPAATSPVAERETNPIVPPVFAPDPFDNDGSMDQDMFERIEAFCRPPQIKVNRENPSTNASSAQPVCGPQPLHPRG